LDAIALKISVPNREISCPAAILMSQHRSMAYPAVHYVSTLCHKRHGFRKKVIEQKSVFLFSLQLLPETFLIVRRSERDRLKKYLLVFLFMSDFSET